MDAVARLVLQDVEAQVGAGDDAAVRDAADEACLTVSDKEVICGEMSFDSTDEMTCIQDPESESVKWICS